MAVAAKFRWKQTKCWLLLLACAALWSCAWTEVRRVEGRERPSSACQVAPHWTAKVVDAGGGEHLVDPMKDARGKVVLVAMTVASSLHSLDQAHKLQSLLSYFHDIGMSDLNFILVNSLDAEDHLANLLKKNLNMTIVQQDKNHQVWNKLAGKKDDVFVYDRCGRLTYTIPFPLSIIHPRQQLVESSVISTYLDDLCGHRICDRHKPSVTLDDSADLELFNTTHSTLVDVTQIINTSEKVDYGQSMEDVLSHENDTKLQFVSATTTTTTAQPPASSGLWSFYHKVLKFLPWTSKEDGNAERQLNSVKKFVDLGNKSTGALAKTNDTEEYSCNDTMKGTCDAWPKKKLDHARVCCNLHGCNRSAQFLQKHCRHYPEHRCKKVELVLRCCQERGVDEEANSKASTSSHPKS